MPFLLSGRDKSKRAMMPERIKNVEKINIKNYIFSDMSGVGDGIAIFDRADTADRKSAEPDAYTGFPVWILMWLAVWDCGGIYRTATQVSILWHAGAYAGCGGHGI